ncbi:hypothetical protein K431DRAFT_309546 [Polychaeton citri CBS 116435]|uniref:Uncharacterized protein n=1 Tax=Polychaeton citri CBS 116435 TaxID=1314669 RepID=A0A9P4QHA1_9PEZI|nr:hypothetical protein K431DRAFT_309546 [Polychaeton citri CBS 116435]
MGIASDEPHAKGAVQNAPTGAESGLTLGRKSLIGSFRHGFDRARSGARSTVTALWRDHDIKDKKPYDNDENIKPITKTAATIPKSTHGPNSPRQALSSLQRYLQSTKRHIRTSTSVSDRLAGPDQVTEYDSDVSFLFGHSPERSPPRLSVFIDSASFMDAIFDGPPYSITQPYQNSRNDTSNYASASSQNATSALKISRLETSSNPLMSSTDGHKARFSSPNHIFQLAAAQIPDAEPVTATQLSLRLSITHQPQTCSDLPYSPSINPTEDSCMLKDCSATGSLGTTDVALVSTGSAEKLERSKGCGMFERSVEPSPSGKSQTASRLQRMRSIDAITKVYRGHEVFEKATVPTSMTGAQSFSLRSSAHSDVQINDVPSSPASTRTVDDEIDSLPELYRCKRDDTDQRMSNQTYTGSSRLASLDSEVRGQQCRSSTLFGDFLISQSRPHSIDEPTSEASTDEPLNVDCSPKDHYIDSERLMEQQASRVCMEARFNIDDLPHCQAASVMLKPPLPPTSFTVPSGAEAAEQLNSKVDSVRPFLMQWSSLGSKPIPYPSRPGSHLTKPKLASLDITLRRRMGPPPLPSPSVIGCITSSDEEHDSILDESWVTTSLCGDGQENEDFSERLRMPSHDNDWSEQATVASEEFRANTRHGNCQPSGSLPFHPSDSTHHDVTDVLNIIPPHPLDVEGSANAVMSPSNTSVSESSLTSPFDARHDGCELMHLDTKYSKKHLWTCQSESKPKGKECNDGGSTETLVEEDERSEVPSAMNEQSAQALNSYAGDLSVGRFSPVCSRIGGNRYASLRGYCPVDLKGDLSDTGESAGLP